MDEVLEAVKSLAEKFDGLNDRASNMEKKSSEEVMSRSDNNNDE